MNTYQVIIVPLAFAAMFFGTSESSHHVDYYAEPHYSFKYFVHDSHTGDVKGHQEFRKGDKVKGFYRLHDPDGTIREVHYTSDKHTGFNAIVTRLGHSIHPIHHTLDN